VNSRRWKDPSSIEIGQVWDYIGEDCDLLLLVLDTHELLVPSQLNSKGHRDVNVHVLVLENSCQNEDMYGYEGKTLSYTEAHMRRNFRRVS